MARRNRFRSGRSQERRVGALGWLVLAVLIGVFAVWTVGLVRFVDRLPRVAEASPQKADAIVVLTGGSRRLDEGVALLETDAAPVLFVSGVDERVDGKGIRSLLDDGDTRLPDKLIDCCLVLGHGATDTIGNARETAIWMAVGDRTSVVLVTSNYHMPRAMLEFAHAMPEVRIIPHPVIPPDVRLDSWYRYPGTLALLANEYSKYLFATARVTVAGWFMAVAT
ncbi:YdcF family protein [Thalassobaculum sp. OXR-137]|uniref:YdcF family protein n=1 Tax=Thalassobaculum sp. OXR-137 TaxID=3100173 RepID=UPI002AC9D1B0|nr:YdcF family protein [Thalassobaculum sp. OXR-137]WPZ34993.1 YdcF family protein [Thalassobaculum sp. OXR-137]